MKLDTTIGLKELNGEEIKDAKKEVFTLGKALANVIISADVSGKMKLYELGTKLYKKGIIDIDKSDLVLLKDAVEKSKIYNALVLGQCALLLEDVKEDSKK